MPFSDDDWTAYLTKVHNGIAIHGWIIQRVLDHTRAWHYTVGLSLRDLPELLIRDVPPAVAVDMLNLLAHRQVADGPLVDGDDLDLIRLRSTPYPRGMARAQNTWAGRPPDAPIAALEIEVAPALAEKFTRPGN